MTRLSNAFAGPYPALKPNHVIAAVADRTKTMDKDSVILADLGGCGDRDNFTVVESLGVKM